MKLKQSIATLAAVLVTAAAWADNRAEIVQDWNGTDVGRTTNAYLGFYGHSRTNQQAVNAAATTNAATTVYTYDISAAAYVTNVTVQTYVPLFLLANGTTNATAIVTNVALQKAVAPTLTTPTTNTVNGTAGPLVNQIRAALVALGLVR